RPDAPVHWNQSVLLRTPDGDMDVDRLEQALLAVVSRHDALRLRFARNDAGEWFQQVAPSEDGRILGVVDLRASGEDWKNHLRTHGERLQASLNLGSGPVIRAGWFRLPDGSGRLLLAIHHLSVDGVSWRILLGDLQEALEQTSSAITLSPAVLPWSVWVEAVRHYGERPEAASELAWWQTYLADTSPDLPVDLTVERPAASSQMIRWQANEDLTRRLIEAAPRAYRMGVEDVLLAALGQALGKWSNQNRVLVDLEGHGREDVLPGLDLSSTVGWFTTRYTAVVPVAEDARNSLIGTKESIRSIPDKGFGLGVLRHMAREDIRNAAHALPRSLVSFNYLGQFDQTLKQGGPLGFASENAGSSTDANGTMDYVLDLNGMVAGGRLSFSWRFSSDAVSVETIQNLTERFDAALQALIAHCESAIPERTAADVPLARLNQTDLEQLDLTGDDVEDVYAATPLQQGLLFHSQLATGEGLYVTQKRLTLKGRLDRQSLKAAWQDAVSRHAILRTRFVSAHGGDTVQVVQRNVVLPFVEDDWSDLDQTTYDTRLADWLAQDRVRGFDPAVAPLVRLALFDRPDGAFDLVWTDHHALMDGWGSAELFGQVMADYQARAKGKEPALPPVTPYRNYVAWLQAQPDPEPWWRERIAVLDEPATLTEALGRPLHPEPGSHDMRQQLGVDLTSRLERLARKTHVTLNTVMQGAWALLLGRYGSQPQALFGVTVSGRPASLPGMERMLGLFINSLPVWVDIPASGTIGPWLREIQSVNAALREREHTSLPDVQRWSGRRG
ncbi:condensation domain-containing protein, partial [Acetobacter senegalensis]|uniref:condensation domain-containing protein n=1 Tax=Acetobacter senegalensis TaxID=446692 RepID=UPI0020A1A4E7